MRLITMYQKTAYSKYIEGFHERYKCITLWNDSDGLQILSSNRVPKYTNPFK